MLIEPVGPGIYTHPLTWSQFDSNDLQPSTSYTHTRTRTALHERQTTSFTGVNGVFFQMSELPFPVERR